MRYHHYYVYILTNPRKTVLYIGVTNSLVRRLREHYEQRGKKKTFTGRYYVHQLVYFEEFQWIQVAIAREKELKGWTRKKKEELIASLNPRWNSLNKQFIPTK